MTDSLSDVLKNHQSLIHQLLQRLGEGVLGIDRHGKIVVANAAIEDLLAYSTGEMIGRKIFELAQSLNLIKFREQWYQSPGSVPHNRKAVLTSSKGVKVEVNLTSLILPFSSEEIILWIVNKSASEDQWGDFPQRLDIAFWEWRLTDGHFAVSENFFKLLDAEDINLPDLKQQNIVNVLRRYMAGDDFELLIKNIKSLQATKSPFYQTFENRAATTENRNILFIARPVFQEEVVTGIRGGVLPIPLSIPNGQNDDLSFQIIDQSDAMMCWIAPDCRLIYANQSFCRLTGYGREEIETSLEITDIDVEYSKEQWEGIWQRAVNEKNIEIESTFKTKANRIFPVEYFLNYFENGDQKLLSLSARNITDRRNKEAVLRKSLLEVNSLSEQLEAENIYLKKEMSAEHDFENIITRSDQYKEVLKKIRHVAHTEATVLIIGETGTGKELLAHAIHNLSERKDRALVKVNCAALSEELILSELFGHEKGAFTGAFARKIGRFELADRGTLFLDEIGELPPKIQATLLRVLQEGEFERVGGVETIRVDVRVIAATNRDLEKMVEQKTFREDLYYRLQVFPIHNLSLRERKEDIQLLVHHFMNYFCKKYHKNIQKIRAADLKRMENYSFPGNIRELMNIIEQAVVISTSETLDLSYWKPSGNHQSFDKEYKEFLTLEELNRQHIIEALEKAKWKVTGNQSAAELLGLKGQTLFSKMRKLGINRNSE